MQTYRFQPPEVTSARLDELSAPRHTVSQDTVDAYNAMREFARLARCYNCLRMTLYGYVCRHCGDVNPSDPLWNPEEN